MHHKKQKGSPGGGGAPKDARFEAMQRLRYLNKKPLCLQYNVQNTTGRRNSHFKNKRKEPLGLIRLLQYLISLVQTELWDFVSKPADQLFAPDRSTSPSKNGNKTRCFRQEQSKMSFQEEAQFVPEVHQLHV